MERDSVGPSRVADVGGWEEANGELRRFDIDETGEGRGGDIAAAARGSDRRRLLLGDGEAEFVEGALDVAIELRVRSAIGRGVGVVEVLADAGADVEERGHAGHGASLAADHKDPGGTGQRDRIF
jgi:hypothetical protein